MAECDPKRLVPTATLIDLGFDSLTVIETAEGIEAELPDIRFNDEDLGELKNLGDVYDLVESQLKEQVG